MANRIMLAAILLTACGESAELDFGADSSVGGAAIEATGGAVVEATGGVSAIAATGGAQATGGTFATGGAATGGSATGGRSTGGAGTGGAATGGTVATGGVGTGGVPAKSGPWPTLCDLIPECAGQTGRCAGSDTFRDQTVGQGCHAATVFSCGSLYGYLVRPNDPSVVPQIAVFLCEPTGIGTFFCGGAADEIGRYAAAYCSDGH